MKKTRYEKRIGERGMRARKGGGYEEKERGTKREGNTGWEEMRERGGNDGWREDGGGRGFQFQLGFLSMK